jgi:uncharacterized membrane protein YfcA
VDEEGDLHWTRNSSLLYPAIAVFAGIAAGLLGIGGRFMMLMMLLLLLLLLSLASSVDTAPLENLCGRFKAQPLDGFLLLLLIFPFTLGGMVLGPLLVTLGCDPLTTAATSAFAVLITATSGLFQVIIGDNGGGACKKGWSFRW